jgi:hypothetical protein
MTLLFEAKASIYSWRLLSAGKAFFCPLRRHWLAAFFR